MGANFEKRGRDSTGIALWRPVLLVLLGAGLWVACYFSPEPVGSTESGIKMYLPQFVGPYVGVDEEISKAELTILPKDTEFARKVYHDAFGDRILCSIVLAGAESRSIHRPEICLPGQGWTIRGGRVVPIKLKDGRELKVMCLELQRQVETPDGREFTIRSLYMYWFVGRDALTPYHWERIFLTSWDRVVRGVQHRWAYVIVSSMVTEGLAPNGKNEQQTLEMLKQFIARSAPEYLEASDKAK